MLLDELKERAIAAGGIVVLGFIFAVFAYFTLIFTLGEPTAQAFFVIILIVAVVSALVVLLG
jgi:hypothetical protein